MFGLALDDVNQTLRGAFDAQWRLWAGAAFVALALVSIEYDEVIAPGVSRAAEACAAAAGDFSRKLMTFTL